MSGQMYVFGSPSPIVWEALDASFCVSMNVVCVSICVSILNVCTPVHVSI